MEKINKELKVILEKMEELDIICLRKDDLGLFTYMIKIEYNSGNNW